MLLKKNLYFILFISFLFCYFLFTFPSCTSLTTREAMVVPEPASVDNNDIMPAPEVSILHRPQLREQSLSNEPFFISAIPGIEPPESISSYVRFEMNESDPMESIDLLAPELVMPLVEKEIPAEPQPTENKVKQESVKEEVKKETTTTTVGVYEKEVKTIKEKPIEVKKEIKSSTKDTATKEKKNNKKDSAAKEKKIVKKEETLPRISELFSHKGENIEISFNQNGWIFSGYIHDTDAGGVKYVSKDTTYQDCIFTFKSMKTGDFDLEFMLQDHNLGSQEKEIVRVHVLADTEFIPDNYDDFITTSTSAAELYDQGDYKQALESYLAIYDPASPELNTKIAELYEKLGEPEKALPFWEYNFKREDTYSTDAAEKLLSYSLEEKNPESMTYLTFLMDNGKLCPLDDVLEIATILENKKDYDHAIDLLASYLSLSNEQNMMDSIYYRLAGLYETDTRIRDLKQAKYYYEKVVSDFPSSSYVRSSQKRLKYLNRHFFYIH